MSAWRSTMERDRNCRLKEIISEGRSPLTRDMIELLRRMGTNDLDVPGARVVQLIDALLAAQAQVAAVLDLHPQPPVDGPCWGCDSTWPCPTAKAIGVSA